jgi:hypothetical protein
MQKICKNNYCEKCDYNTMRKSSYDNHILSRKHILATSSDNPQQILCNKYECEFCNKEYKTRSGLWRHKQKCIKSEEKIIELQEEIPKSEYINDIINKLIQENKLLIEQNQEIMKLMVNNNNNTTNNNQTINGNVNNNNKFNINVFLNEKCKDAINFAEFIKNIEVSHEDLENNAQLGFVNGISKIIMDNLKQLSIYHRPIHCSDAKRETMYIKDENKWEKEEDTKKLTNAIQEVSRKSMISLVEWQDKNPDFQDMDSEFSNKCITMTQQCIAGSNRDILYPKVIRTLAKETTIDKVNLIQ